MQTSSGPRSHHAPRPATYLGRSSLFDWHCNDDARLKHWGRRPNLRHQPSSRRHALLHMRAVRFGRQWPFPSVTRVIAEQAGGNDVITGVRTTLGSRMEMLCGASEDFRQSSRSAGYWQTRVQGFIPHREIAVKAAPPLCEHLLTAQILQCFHGTGPFIRLREKRMRDARNGRSPAGSSCSREAR